MWYRVFGRNSTEPSPAALAERLHAAGIPVEPHFKGDDLGWSSGEFLLPGSKTPVRMDRYLTAQDEIRDDLNTHAAILESCDYSPNHGALMERVTQTEQLIVIRKPVDAADEVSLEKVLLELCRSLADSVDGVYQIDGEGWFDSSGELLLKEY